MPSARKIESTFRVAPLTLCKYSGISGYNELESEWLQLFRESGTSFLHHPVWYGAYINAHEKEPALVIFYAFRLNGQLVAVIPLRKRKKSINKFRMVISYTAWELYYPSEMGVCDISIKNGIPLDQILDALLTDLNQQTGWDSLDLLFFWKNTSLLKSVLQYPRFFVKPSHVSKYLAIEGDYESWINRYSKKFQRNLRRKLNNLQKKGNVRFEVVSEKAGMDKAFDAFLQVEDSGWKGSKGTSIVKQSDKLDCYRRLLDGFGETGQVVIHLLWLDDKCIGAQFGFHVLETLYLQKIGYDESYSSESPGFLMVDNLVKEACHHDNVKRISFVTSRSWMDVWKPWEEPVLNAYHYNGSIKGRALKIATRLYEKAKSNRQAAVMVSNEEETTTDDNNELRIN
jgi:CelD/BcsL family acetyltransferase involved in cellulose biosynthesis